ncbi:MAG: GNAT family N-acetyltransferase [Acidimicrobiales bacterium]
MPPLDELTPDDVLQYRFASPADADAIAALHVDSWRRHYRGAYRDEYLDRGAPEDRRTFWRERFRVASEDQFTVVAQREPKGDREGDGEAEGEGVREGDGEGYLAGFAHTCLDADPQWGALLDNLHVRYYLKRQGVGRALMAKSAAALLERRPASRLYLYVLQQNAAAQGFYAALGGVVVGEEPARPIAGGGTAPVYRVAWRDPRLLLRAQG